MHNEFAIEFMHHDFVVEIKALLSQILKNKNIENGRYENLGGY